MDKIIPMPQALKWSTLDMAMENTGTHCIHPPPPKKKN
jgi:hypothetical protein